MPPFSVEDLMRIASGQNDVLRRASDAYQASVEHEAALVKQFGSDGSLSGRLQERYGYAKDEAEKNIDAWLKGIN